MLRVRPIVLACIAALVAVAGWFAWQRWSRSPFQEGKVLLLVVDKNAETEVAAKPRHDDGLPPKDLPRTLQDYEARFRESDDLLAFLEAVAPAAEAGDSDALYYSARASERCTRMHLLYFGRDERHLTLDQALERNYRIYDEQNTRDTYRKCVAFKAAPENPFRDWKALLTRAADAGSPRAMAMLAVEKYRDAFPIQDHQAQERLRADARNLARDAIRSRDAEVMSLLSTVASEKAGLDGDVQYVWIIAACQRGFECGRENEDFRNFCMMDPACQPFETFVDVVRRASAERFDELQLRANELNQMIDAGRFDEIGL